MSGGSQHPNGRQSQMGPGWSPLQLQMANLLARAPQAHMASERGVTWHTPTPPPHLYHVPVPSPPDPLQAMKGAAGNSVFRHTATPPELFRHTPTPPDKHLLRHTPSPGDVKAGGPIPPVDLYPHLGPGREKLRPEDLLAYARGGVDLSLGSRANGSPAHPASPALSVRDAPTINSLIARAAPRHAHARVDSLLERLVPSPHSVIVHSRAAPTPSPPSSNEDSADSCGAPPGSKRKRKPERTIRVPVPPVPSPPPPALTAHSPPPPALLAPCPSPPALLAPSSLHNGDTKPPQPLEAPPNGPQPPTSTETPPTISTPDLPHARRKSRSGSAETIDDIAAMIANTDRKEPPERPPEIIPPETPVSIDKLKSVLCSPDPAEKTEIIEDIKKSPQPVPEEKEKSQPEISTVETAAAPKRRSVRTSNTESANVPVKSPSEAKPAEPETSDTKTAQPTAACFVEVENQLEKMFAGLEEEQSNNNEENKKVDETAKTEESVAVEDKTNKTPETEPVQPKKRRKSGPQKGGEQAKAARRSSRVPTAEETPRRKPGRKKMVQSKPKKAAKDSAKDAYDSGSNASSSRSRGPYVQIRGPRDSPVSVAVINAATGEDEEPTARRKPEEFRNGLKARGLHASTLGLRYDATTPDVTWLCAFCNRGPHANILGDLFGPYTVTMDCEEYRALDETTRRRYEESTEVWFHESCGVWAPGLIAAGARLWGLPSAVWGARSSVCSLCDCPGAAVACSARACRSRIHLPCATSAKWTLHHEDFRAFCPRHA